MLGYQIFVDGTTLPLARGNFRAGNVNFLETRDAARANQDKGQQRDTQTPLRMDGKECSLAPSLVKFLRPEGAIMGADLRQYGPFSTGEVAPLPYVHAMVFVANGAAEIFG